MLKNRNRGKGEKRNVFREWNGKERAYRWIIYEAIPVQETRAFYDGEEGEGERGESGDGTAIKRSVSDGGQVDV